MKKNEPVSEMTYELYMDCPVLYLVDRRFYCDNCYDWYSESIAITGNQWKAICESINVDPFNFPCPSCGDPVLWTRELWEKIDKRVTADLNIF